MRKIPLIDDLTRTPVPPGSNVLIEFEPTSQWYNSSLTMAAGWVKQGGDVGYNGFAPYDRVRTQLTALGLNVDELERDERILILDWYTPTLGRKSRDGIESLKVADLSIEFRIMDDPNETDPDWTKETLRIVDNFSTLARFNDEKSWIEFMLTRVLPLAPATMSTLVFGIMKGVHSEWAYRQLEGSADGVVEFNLQDVGKETRDVVQIRSMRNVHYSRELTELRMDENFQVQLNI